MKFLGDMTKEQNQLTQMEILNIINRVEQSIKLNMKYNRNKYYSWAKCI